MFKIKIQECKSEFTSLKTKTNHRIQLMQNPEFSYNENDGGKLIYYDFITSKSSEASKFATSFSKCLENFYQILKFYFKNFETKLSDYNKYYWKLPDKKHSLNLLFLKIDENKDYKPAYFFTTIFYEIFYEIIEILKILISLEFKEFETYLFHIRGIRSNFTHVIKNSQYLFENDSLNPYCLKF